MTPSNTPKFSYKYIKKIPFKAMDWVGSPGSLVLHTVLFFGSFVLGFMGYNWDRILLVVTTLVSLEAIYLAIFIQMGVNRTNQSLQDVEEDIEEIQEDVGQIQENVEDLGEDVVSLQEDVEEISGDIDEISTEEIDGQKSPGSTQTNIVLSNIESQLQYLIKEVEILKGGKQK
jgi:hypothetical protein